MSRYYQASRLATDEMSHMDPEEWPIHRDVAAAVEPGHYVDLNVTPHGLELIATDNLREDAEQFHATHVSEMDALYELLEDHTSNSDWEFVLPEEVGALTDGALLADRVDRDEHGEITEVGNVYWDSKYQVDSTVEELLTTGKVIWEGPH